MKKKSDKKKLLECLEENPNLAFACRKTGIHRSTVYRWQENNIDFVRKLETAQELGRDKLNDFTEGKLVENIQKGNQRAIEYYSNHNHSRYMDLERRDVISKKIKPITVNRIEFVNFKEEKQKETKQSEDVKKEQVILLPAPRNST